MNKFEAIAVAAIVGLAELVSVVLFLMSFAVWIAVLSGSL